MESNFSVLLYSKYSATSKQLMDVMNSSKVDFLKSTGLQNLCVDNEEVRNRIIQNKQINITSVPCILVIFPDGIIEKYEGLHTFKWIEEIISSFKSTRAQISNEQSSNELKHLELQKQLAHERQLDRDRQDRERREKQQEERERERERDQNREKHETLEQNREKQNEKNRQQQREKHSEQQPREKQSEQNREQNDAPKQHNRKKVVKKQSDNLDTFKSIPKPVARIREDSGNYSQIDDLFQGEEVVDVRRTDKSNMSRKNDSSNDIMSKAKELAKLRESDAAPPPPGHPSNNQNN
jgi:flagellar biosynthesis GTPase FlhF